MTTAGLKGKPQTGPPSAIQMAIYRLVRFLTMTVGRLVWGLRFVGLEHVPKSGAFIVAPVHRSNVDSFLMSGLTRQRIRVIGKDSLWRVHPAFSWLISTLGGFPVARGTADREALRRCLEIVEAGEPLVMFPEGTRCTGLVVEHVFDGPAYVASRTGVPIVPVGISGTEKGLPVGAKFIKRSKVEVLVGPPLRIEPAADGSRPSRRQVRELTEQLQAEIQRLFDEARSHTE